MELKRPYLNANRQEWEISDTATTVMMYMPYATTMNIWVSGENVDNNLYMYMFSRTLRLMHDGISFDKILPKQMGYFGTRIN
jgi:hypothetical protein